MPQVIVPVAMFFANAASAGLAAVGLAGLGTSIGGVIASAGMALGFQAGIGAGLAAWGTVVALGSNVASMVAKVPKPESAGIQLNNLQDPNAGTPFVFGRTAVGGNVIYEAVSGTKNVRLSRVIALSTGPIEGFESFSANDYEITWNSSPEDGLGECVSTTAGAGSKMFISNMRMGYQYGAQPTIDPATSTGTAMPGIDSASKTSGLAIAIQHFDYAPETWPSGLPTDMRWVIKGEKLYDPRKDSTYPGGSGSHRVDDPSTYEWGENPFICALNFVLGRYQNVAGTNTKVWGLGAPWSQCDVAAFVHAANVADLNGFKCGGAFSSTDDPYAVLNTLLQAGSGVPINRGAQISVFVNAPVTSVYSITEADIIGTATVKNSTAFADRKNTVRYSSREETQKWQMWTGGSISPSIHIDEDRGEVRSMEVAYTAVQDVSQAATLARYDLENTREFLTIDAVCKPHLLTARVGDAVVVNLPNVATPDQKCVVIGRSFDPQSLEVRLNLRSERDEKHPYALGETAEAPASPGLKGDYDHNNPEAPGDDIWLIEGVSVASDAGVSIPALRITGSCDDPNAATIICEYRPYESGLDADENWIAHAEVPHNATRFEILSVTGGQSYQGSIRYRSVVGVLTPRRILGPVTAGDFTIPTTSIVDDDDDGSSLLRDRLAWLKDQLAQLGIDLEALGLDLAQLNTDLDNLDTGIPGFPTAPDPAGYAEGKFYFNTSSNKLFVLKSGAWTALQTGIKSASSNPSSGMVAGDLYLNTSDNKLYRYTGSAWTAAVAAVDVTGTLSNSQIADLAASKLTGSITSTQITDNAVTTAKINAGAVVTAKIAANAVTANEIASNSISTAKLQAGAITANELATDAVTANKIQAGAISTAKLAAGAVTANEIASNTITGGKIAANAIASSHISADQILATHIGAEQVTTNKIAAGAITAFKIGAAQVTATHVAADAITANNIVAGTITTGKLIGGAVTGIVSGYGPTPSNVSYTAETCLYTGFNNEAGGPTVHWFTAEVVNYSTTNKHSATFRVKRNGSQIKTYGMKLDTDHGAIACFQWQDSPGVGYHYYEVTVESGDGGPISIPSAPQWTAGEFKR